MNDVVIDIYKAFGLAQSEFPSPKKDSVNPHFRSRYADLASVVDAIREPLAKHGLFFRQEASVQDHAVTVTTDVCNHYGSCIRFGSVTIPVSRADAHAIGSALTYARRYGLLMLGLTPEDDDGNEAVGRQHLEKAAQPAKSPAPSPDRAEYTAAVKRLVQAASELGITHGGAPLADASPRAKRQWFEELCIQCDFPHETPEDINSITIELQAMAQDEIRWKAVPGAVKQTNANKEEAK